jgi:hypothetical protein
MPLSQCKQLCRNEKKSLKTMQTKRKTMIMTRAGQGLGAGVTNAFIERGYKRRDAGEHNWKW